MTHSGSVSSPVQGPVAPAERLLEACKKPFDPWMIYSLLRPNKPTPSAAAITQSIVKALKANTISDEDGNTPLHHLSSQGELDLAQLLIINDAVVKAKNHLGETPLHHACRKGFPEMANLLLNWGADVEAVDLEGKKCDDKLDLEKEALMEIIEEKRERVLQAREIWDSIARDVEEKSKRKVKKAEELDKVSIKSDKTVLFTSTSDKEHLSRAKNGFVAKFLSAKARPKGEKKAEGLKEESKRSSEETKSLVETLNPKDLKQKALLHFGEDRAEEAIQELQRVTLQPIQINETKSEAKCRNLPTPPLTHPKPVGTPLIPPRLSSAVVAIPCSMPQREAPPTPK